MQDGVYAGRHQQGLPVSPGGSPAGSEGAGQHLFAGDGRSGPEEIDGLGKTVSSNNKIVAVKKSSRPVIDIGYLVGQVVMGKSQVDDQANCGNMTFAVGPFAVEAALQGAVVSSVFRQKDQFDQVRIGHPGGVITITPEIRTEQGRILVPRVGVVRTARRIMEGTRYIRNEKTDSKTEGPAPACRFRQPGLCRGCRCEAFPR